MGSCTDREFNIVNDTQLDAEPNGDPMIYWDGQAHKLAAVTALLSSVEILKLTSGAMVRLLARYSMDKVSWYPIGTDGFIDGTSAGLVAVTDTAPYLYQFTCDPKQLANYVQFGVQVEDGAARATVHIKTLAVALPQTMAAQTSAIGTSAVDIWAARDVSAFDAATVQVSLTSALTGTDNLVVTIYAVADCGVVLGTIRTPLESQTMSVANGNPQYLTIQLSGLPQSLQIKAQRGDANSTSTVTCAVQLRAAR